MGVWAPGRIEGRFARVTATSLILEANDGQTIEVPLFAVREWRVADGDRGHALAGGLLGLAGAVVTGSELGAVVGTGLGALIGSQIRTPWLRRRSLRPIRPTPLPGTLVRLRSDDERRGGTVLVWSPDSVVLKSGDRIHSFGRPNVRSVEWPVGRGSWGPPGARIGASVGATAGVLLGLLIDSECKSSDHFFCGAAAAAEQAVMPSASASAAVLPWDWPGTRSDRRSRGLVGRARRPLPLACPLFLFCPPAGSGSRQWSGSKPVRHPRDPLSRLPRNPTGQPLAVTTAHPELEPSFRTMIWSPPNQGWISLIAFRSTMKRR